MIYFLCSWASYYYSQGLLKNWNWIQPVLMINQPFIPDQQSQRIQHLPENMDYQERSNPEIQINEKKKRNCQTKKRKSGHKIKISKSAKICKNLISAKKNSEGNLVNQLYSFFIKSSISQQLIDRAIKRLGRFQMQEQQIKCILCDIIKLIKFKQGRKYLNKTNVLKYFTPKAIIKNAPGIMAILSFTKIISLDEVCWLFRVVAYHFMRNASILAIITSKRIIKGVKNEHLKKRRVITQSMESSQN